MPIHRFEDLPQEHATPQYSTAFGGIITGEKIEVGRLAYPPNTGAMAHQHPSEQILVVVKGRLRVRSGEDDVVIGPLEGYVVPGGELHQVTALEEEVIVYSGKNLVGGKGHKI